MITAKQLQEAKEKIEGRYYDQLREYAKENLERLVHDYCFKYKLDFVNGMGTWTMYSHNISSWDGFNPEHDANHIEILFEELVCDCEEFREDAHDDIQRIVSQCGFEDSQELKNCIEEGKPIFALLNESASPHSTWGELIEYFKYERFPEQNSKSDLQS